MHFNPCGHRVETNNLFSSRNLNNKSVDGTINLTLQLNVNCSKAKKQFIIFFLNVNLR